MDGKYFTLIFSCLLVSVRSQQEIYDYCDPSLKLCPVATDHVMCKFPVPGLSPQCTKSVHDPLSSTEKDRILYWHNKFRSYVASGTEKNKPRKLPTASNMRQMYWDGELETLATRWAEQCMSTTSATVYDKCRNTKRFQVSQNVGGRRVNGTTIDKQAPQIVITWYKENKDLDPALVDKFVPAEDDKVSVRQFVNIIWANTHAIGCARVIFQERLQSGQKDPKVSLWTIERLVCNYGPGGNEIGKAIYKRGAPCENCPSGTDCSRNFPGLCAILSLNRTEETRSGKEEQKTNSTTKEVSGTQVPEESKEQEESNDDCEGDSCFASPGNTINEIIKRPSENKKSREVGLLVPDHGDDINIEKIQWSISMSSKVRRDGTLEKFLKNGDRCKCYIPMQTQSGSSRLHTNATFLLLLSIYIAVQFFFLSANRCK